MSENIDIEKNINEFIHGPDGKSGILSLERYSSYDYCFNYFQEFREQGQITKILETGQIQFSCLQLGFYLASWGMLRGSSFLLEKSVKVLEPVIFEIANCSPKIWEIDVNEYSTENISILLEFRNQIIRILPYANGPSDILITKIMLGVFGNTPAFDTNYKKGFGVSTFGPKSLMKIADYYRQNSQLIGKYQIPTLDYQTGKPTQRKYTRAKVIDMIYFIEGSKIV